MTIPVWVAFAITCFAVIVAFCAGCAWHAICATDCDTYVEIPEKGTLPIARKYQKFDRDMAAARRCK